MKFATVVGIILIGLGVLLLAYLTSPVRFLVLETIGAQKMNPVPPILGGIALVSGIALLVVVRPNKKKSEL